MKDYRYGDVVWVNLDPSAGHEQGKRRPVVVVSNDAYNRFNNLTMVVSDNQQQGISFACQCWCDSG